MKKSDFIEVHVYQVSSKKGVYGGGIMFSADELDVSDDYIYDGTTLLTKEFFKKYASEYGILDFTYIE